MTREVLTSLVDVHLIETYCALLGSDWVTITGK